jgi:Tfp pilus assembly protein PilO
MFERTQLRKLITSFALRIVAAVVVTAIIVTICANQITKISRSILEKKRLATILEQKSETLRQLEQDLAIIGTGDAKIREALPPSNNILDFIAVLEALAVRSSVKQTTRFGTPTPVTPEGSEGMPIAKIDYSISINGNVHTLYSYLKNFENLPYFTRINSFSIQSGSELGWEGESTVSIGASVFVHSNNF